MTLDERGRTMLTTSEVANLLHVHINTVRRWSDRGLIKGYRICARGDRRFDRGDIIRFLNKMTTDRGNQTRVDKP
ncbi:MAG: helix-turn-helix domain-containing protein [Chloroflexi bacterium]|nr:helix-turn-helix domain-containing protein [Chloroflexota bacterium]MBI3930531.1 helix-turn-helix domain-containing protein [Chloroflexota bacterium]